MSAKILLQEHVNDRCQAVRGARGIGHHVVIGLKNTPGWHRDVAGGHRPNSHKPPVTTKNLDILPDSTKALTNPSKRMRLFPSNFRVCDFCPPETSQEST